jgi:hypothetical protein
MFINNFLRFIEEVRANPTDNNLLRLSSLIRSNFILHEKDDQRFRIVLKVNYLLPFSNFTSTELHTSDEYEEEFNEMELEEFDNNKNFIKLILITNERDLERKDVDCRIITEPAVKKLKERIESINLYFKQYFAQCIVYGEVGQFEIRNKTTMYTDIPAWMKTNLSKVKRTSFFLIFFYNTILFLLGLNDVESIAKRQEMMRELRNHLEWYHLIQIDQLKYMKALFYQYEIIKFCDNETVRNVLQSRLEDALNKYYRTIKMKLIFTPNSKYIKRIVCGEEP